VFGARSPPSILYKELFRRSDIELLEVRTYSTGGKMTPEQARRELRDGLEIAREIYGSDVPAFEEVWERYGPAIERHGYGMYSKITVLIGRKR